MKLFISATDSLISWKSQEEFGALAEIMRPGDTLWTTSKPTAVLPKSAAVS
jgi:hypothetical protein